VPVAVLVQCVRLQRQMQVPVPRRPELLPLHICQQRPARSICTSHSCWYMCMCTHVQVHVYVDGIDMHLLHKRHCIL
jgi:hypothetical protein